MVSEAIDMGVVSSRGQVAIPLDIRKILSLDEGSKILFVVKNDTLLLKKVTAASFASLTKPLREAKKKMKESDVVDFIHRVRREKRR